MVWSVMLTAFFDVDRGKLVPFHHGGRGSRVA